MAVTSSSNASRTVPRSVVSLWLVTVTLVSLSVLHQCAAAESQSSSMRGAGNKGSQTRRGSERQNDVVEIPVSGTSSDSAPPFTIITLAKKFAYPYNVTQSNAINSWKHLKCKPQIVVIGVDYGVADAAKELGVDHINQDPKRSWYEAPLLKDMLDEGEAMARSDHILLINADIILPQSFCQVFHQILADYPDQTYLLTGVRYNIQVLEPVDYDELERTGQWFEGAERFWSSAQDYFGYVKGTLKPDPQLSLLFSWDNWIITWAIQEFSVVIDATDVVVAVHQDHSYTHQSAGKKNIEYFSRERTENRDIALSSCHEGRFLPVECSTHAAKWCEDNHKKVCLTRINPVTCDQALGELAKIEVAIEAEKNSMITPNLPHPRSTLYMMNRSKRIKTKLVDHADPKDCPITNPYAGMSPRSQLYLMSCHYGFQNLGFKRGEFLYFVESVNKKKPLPDMPGNKDGHFHFTDWEKGPASDGGVREDANDPRYPVVPVVTTWTQCDVVIREPTVVFSPLYFNNLYHALHDSVLPLYKTLHFNRRMSPQTEGSDDDDEFVDLNTNIIITDTVEKPFQGNWRQLGSFEILKLFSANPVYFLSELTKSGLNFCFSNIMIGLDLVGTFKAMEARLDMKNKKGFPVALPPPKPTGTAGDDLSSRTQLDDTQFVISFRKFVLSRFNIRYNRQVHRETPRITFISRALSRSRSLKNEKQLIAAAEKQLGMPINVVRFEGTPIQQQIQIVLNTDILAGVHGAGFTHVIWLQPKSVVAQLLPYKVKETKWGDSFRRFSHNVGVRKEVDFETRESEVEFMWDMLVEFIDLKYVRRYRSREQVMQGPDVAFDFVGDVSMRYFWLEQNLELSETRFIDFLKAAIGMWHTNIDDENER
eukprot:GFYU01003049.1.p1 GENE.GFYU01003049.1~~GFYU01003049.1.p1  ORF type:complete len:879 (-),score=272.82 GFYU01003049.1:89-2725(-)